jgi:hypothetical protein
MHKLPLLALTPFALAACSEVVVPVNVGVDVPVDIDAARAAFERDVCGDIGSDACAVLDALDKSDDGAATSPPALPALLPFAVDVARAAARENVDVQRWFSERQADVGGALSPEHFLPLTVPEGVPADALADIGVDGVEIALVNSSLTFALPPFDVIVGDGYVYDDAGNVTGAKDAGDRVAVTVDDNGGPLVFADGGVARLTAALQTPEPWIALVPQAPLTLDSVEEALVRPGGAAVLRATLALSVPVSFADLQQANATLSETPTTSTTPTTEGPTN